MGNNLETPLTSTYVEEHFAPGFRATCAEMQTSRAYMEDTHLIECRLPQHPFIGLFGVFDGHAGGAVSRLVSTTIARRINSLQNPMDAAAVTGVFIELDSHICRNTDARSGCTAAMIIVDRRAMQLLVVNLGDSRVVVMSKPDGPVVFESTDHKPSCATELSRVRAAGGTVSADNRIDGEINLSRAFGDIHYKSQPHLSIDAQKIIARPDTARITIAAGFRILIMTDGLLETQESNTIRKMIKDRAVDDGFADKRADILVDILNTLVLAGTNDNMTLMEIDILYSPNDFAAAVTRVYNPMFINPQYLKYPNFTEAVMSELLRRGITLKEAVIRALRNPITRRYRKGAQLPQNFEELVEATPAESFMSMMLKIS